MAQFDAFQFMRDRQNCEQLDQQDIEQFNLFSVNRLLSMVKGREKLACVLNTPQFYALPNAIKAQAFTTLNGAKLSTKWKKSKTSSTEVYLKKIDKIMKLLKCGQSDAMFYIANNLMSDEMIDENYSICKVIEGGDKINQLMNQKEKVFCRLVTN